MLYFVTPPTSPLLGNPVPAPAAGARAARSSKTAEFSTVELEEGPTINFNYFEIHSQIFENYLERAQIKTFLTEMVLKYS